MTKYQCLSRRHAFTLVELLVVMSIISLLIAILIPALANARTAAHRTQSLSNLRQLLIATHAYAGENKSSLPMGRFSLVLGPPLSSTSPTWAGVYWKMNLVTNISVFWSPMRNTTALDLVGMRSNPNNTHWLYPGYGLSGYATPEVHTTVSGTHPVRLDNADVPTHSKYLLMAECFDQINHLSNTRPGWFQITAAKSVDTLSRGMFNYGGSVAHGFLDGHANATDGSNMGWNPSIIGGPGTNAYNVGNLSGHWTYTAVSQYTDKEPWYR